MFCNTLLCFIKPHLAKFCKFDDRAHNSFLEDLMEIQLGIAHLYRNW